MHARCLCLLLVTACAPRLDVGAPCRFNTECTPPYACVAGRCGTECMSQEDCTFPGRCVAVQGVGRCFLDGRDTCTVAADCGDPGLVCRDQSCFNRCENCAALGAVCEDGVCVRTVVADAGPPDVPGPRDGGGGPVFEVHRPCSETVPCLTGEECVSDDGAQAVCRRPCTGPIPDAGSVPPDDRAECTSFMCVRPADDFTVAYCALTCDPLDPLSCPTGETCDRLDRLRPITGDSRRLWGCRLLDASPYAVDAPCPRPELCPAGTSCQGTPARCLPLCNDRVGTCLDGRTCVTVHSEDEQHDVGACEFPSSDAGIDAGIDAGLDAGP